MRATTVHHEQDEVGGLPADLKADAAAFERHHGRRAPWAGEISPVRQVIAPRP